MEKHIEAKELRVENLVYQDHLNAIVVVSGFFNSSDEVWYYAGDDEYRGPITSFKAIELTEEWLLNFGFKRFCKDFSKKGIIIHTRKRGYVLRKSVPDIKYVHQLQNLYFALTGEELDLLQSKDS